jgi:hypothetical protein
MENFTNTNTLTLWTANLETVQYVQKIAEELNFKIYTPSQISDLIAIPSFLYVIDRSRLNEFLLYLDQDLNDYFLYNATKMAVRLIKDKAFI